MTYYSEDNVYPIEKEDAFPRGRFGKATNKTLRYCPVCIRGDKKNIGIWLTSPRQISPPLSLNKRNRWKMLPSDITKTKTFTTPKKHWRSEKGFYKVSLFYGKPQKWSRHAKAYETIPIPFLIDGEDTRKYKISQLIHDEIPKELKLYVIANQHILWEQMKLFYVHFQGAPFLEWHWGCGEYETSGCWGKNWKRDSKERVIIVLPTDTKVGRWCCCKKGTTEKNGGTRGICGERYREKPQKRAKQREIIRHIWQ